MTKPKTSSAEVHVALTALGLEVELDPAASAAIEDTAEQLCDWYADPARAERARVCAAESRETFSEWLGRPVGEQFEGEDLVTYVADTLMGAAEHSMDRDGAPQLWALEGHQRVLYLLRGASERGDRLVSLNNPDTEAALNGIYRFDGCAPGFADHARSCGQCLEQLKEWDARHGLPENFDILRQWPVPPPKPEPKKLPPLPPASGVAIIIKKKS